MVFAQFILVLHKKFAVSFKVPVNPEVIFCHGIQVLPASSAEVVDCVEDDTLLEPLGVRFEALIVGEILRNNVHVIFSDWFLGDSCAQTFLFHINFDTIKNVICLFEPDVRHNVYAMSVFEVSIKSSSGAFETVDLVVLTIFFAKFTVEIKQCFWQIIIRNLAFISKVFFFK